MSQIEHAPVMRAEVISFLEPKPHGRYLDATFGGGGHTRAILEASSPNGRVLAIDADPDALQRAGRLSQEFPDRIIFQQSQFSRLAELVSASGYLPVDGILMDVGLSSFQLDEPGRGFSFRRAGPLDMRFDPAQEIDASTIVNTWPEEDLIRLLFEFGEESQARRIARAIVQDRQDEPFQSTDQLAGMIERVAGRRSRRTIHPATRTFQALRIAVNHELDELRHGLEAALQVLAPGGKLVVISFHSLEDRIVKTFFRDESRTCICPPEMPVCACEHVARLRVITSKPVRPSQEEQERNPRSRSALLRAAERLV